MKNILLFSLLAMALLGIFLFLRHETTGALSEENFLKSLEKLDSDQVFQLAIQTRDFGIAQAEEEGKYNCCIEPACTMCYLEANQWNNFQAGTCACDALVLAGREPCPQCKKEGCSAEDHESGTCKIK